MADKNTILRLGARGSILSRMQSQQVADALEKLHPGVKVELQIFKTSGDAIADRPLHDSGGKGLFTRELEQALLANKIDLAVHSYKDVPVTMPLVDQTHLEVAAVPAREDVRDVLVCPTARSIDELPHGAKVGTGSLRRKCQLLTIRPDLDVQPIRGNIDTRLKKVQEGEFAAIVLAMAGLRRGGMFDGMLMTPLEADQFLPAAGQGALAIQCRKEDRRTKQVVKGLNDPASDRCVNWEREMVRKLNGDCYSPIGVLARIEGIKVTVMAAAGARGGELPVSYASATAEVSRGAKALDAIFLSLVEQGAIKRLG